MPFPSGRIHRKLFLSLMLSGSLLIPTACSQFMDSNAQSSSKSAISSKPENSQTANDRPQGLAKPKGLVDNRRLFQEPVPDPVDRIRRLELAVQDLRDDFDTAIPAMAGLIVSESELTQVLQDLKRSGTLTYTDIAPPKDSKLPRQPLEPSTPPTRLADNAATGPEKASEKPVAQKADKMSAEASDTKKQDIQTAKPEKSKSTQTGKILPEVVNVRFGTYPDKTRIVLDLSAPSGGYNVDLDNQEKLLVLEVKNASWDAKKSFNFETNPLLASFSAQNTEDGGSRLLMELKSPVKILKKFALRAAGEKKDRIVLDIGPK